MSERSRFIKIRVTESEYRDLRARADECGVTMSEHVRCTVKTVHHAVGVVAQLSGLRQQMQQLAQVCHWALRTSMESTT